MRRKVIVFHREQMLPGNGQQREKNRQFSFGLWMAVCMFPHFTYRYVYKHAISYDFGQILLPNLWRKFKKKKSFYKLSKRRSLCIKLIWKNVIFIFILFYFSCIYSGFKSIWLHSNKSYFTENNFTS